MVVDFEGRIVTQATAGPGERIVVAPIDIGALRQERKTRRAHQMLDRAALDDPAETEPEHALQAAERRLQIEIQKALSFKEPSHV